MEKVIVVQALNLIMLISQENAMPKSRRCLLHLWMAKEERSTVQ
jgi:hypothetical protein